MTDAALIDDEALAHDEVQDAEPSAEERARLYGWKPLDEFTGDPSRWNPAEKFLEINDKNAAVGKERMANLERQLRNLQRTSEQAIERARQQERERVRAEMRQAAESGDGERVEKLADELERHSAPAPSNEEPPAVRSFRERNPWFGTDSLKTAEARTLSGQIASANPGISSEDELALVEREMNRRYPTRTERPADPQRRAAMPEQVDGVRLAPRNTSAFDKLPYSAKQQFEMMKAQNVYTDADRESFAADYDAPSITIERRKIAR